MPKSRVWSLIEAVHPPRRFGLLTQIDRLRRVGLHAIRQFVGGDAGRELLLIEPGRMMLLVHPPERIEHVALDRAASFPRAATGR